MSGRGLAGALLRFSGTEQARFNRLCPVTITLKLSCWMAINRRASVSKGSDAFALTLRSIRLAIRIRAFAARGTQLDTRPVSPYKRLATFINRVDFKSVRFHIDQKKISIRFWSINTLVVYAISMDSVGLNLPLPLRLRLYLS